MEVNCLTLKDLISRPPRLDFAIEDGENAQKENIFVDLSRMAPKTPIKNEPIDLSKQKIFTPERNPITPVKLVDRQQAEPWTPTANLKILISAASPDIRDREKKKGLFRPIENKDDAFTDSLQLDAVDDSAVDEFEKQRPSRKQKSLGLLCQKFLDRYPSYPLSTEKTTISLDEVAVSLASANSRKDKSLRIMSQKFVMLFLVSKTKIVTLDVAAKILIEESQDTPDHSKFKTKVRRLYDIANVLTSLVLIKKVHVTEDRGRKPAFKWIGPVDFSSTDDDLMDVSTPVLPELKKEIYGDVQFCAKQKLARHSSFNSEQASERIQRKVNSEPSSPYRQKQGFGVYSLEIGSLAAVSRQKMEDNSETVAFASQNMMPLPSSLDPAAPLPSPSVDSEYHVSPLCHQVLSAAQTDLKALPAQNGLDGQGGVSLASMAPDVERQPQALAAAQPLLYVPPTPLFMLCGGLQEGLSPGSGSGSGSIGGGSEVTAAEQPPMPSGQKRLSKERRIQEEEEEPAAKRQRRDHEDGPLSLVMPKKPSDYADIASPKASENRGSAPHEDTHMNGQLSAAKAVSGKATTNGFVSSEWGNPSSNTEIEKPSEENESTKEPSPLQYLYVQSPAGLNGLSVLLPGSQSPHAVGLPVGPLPSLSVPYMVLPSPTLGGFPVLYSPPMPGPVSSAPSPLPNVGPVNFGLPGLGSTAHLLIGAAAVVNPKSSTLPSTDPQLQGPCSLHLSPVMSRSHGSVQPGSPAYGGLPASTVKLQQSQVPVTPKSIRCTHQETFFKTPGSLGDPVLGRKERNQSRSSSSAQRRLEIPSGGTD
nr:transcription factor E2F7 isoform X3 [Bubalus bubalis]